MAAKSLLRKATDANLAAKELADKAGGWVGMAFQPAVEYILTIGANNPAEKVVKRSDVKSAISHTTGAAVTKALQVFEQAWVDGVDSGQVIAEAEAKRLKITLPKRTLSTAVKDRLQGDIEGILAGAQEELLRGYQEDGESGLKAAQKRLAWRTSLAVEAAYKHARAEAMTKMFAGMGLLKQWVTTSVLPCSNCLALAALGPIPWADEFPAVLDGVPILKVYAKKFLGPPRHPNCGCILVVVKKGGSGGG